MRFSLKRTGNKWTKRKEKEGRNYVTLLHFSKRINFEIKKALATIK